MHVERRSTITAEMPAEPRVSNSSPKSVRRFRAAWRAGVDWAVGQVELGATNLRILRRIEAQDPTPADGWRMGADWVVERRQDGAALDSIRRDAEILLAPVGRGMKAPVKGRRNGG